MTNINCTNKKWIKYKNIAYVGSNLHVKNKSMHLHNSVAQVQYIDLSKCSKRIFFITTTVRDILYADPDTIIIPSASRYRNNSHEVSIIGDDGVVLLYYAIIAKKGKIFPMKFDYDFATKIKKVKNSTIKKGADYNGSTGLYYSFGNKGSYEMIDNSTVG